MARCGERYENWDENAPKGQSKVAAVRPKPTPRFQLDDTGDEYGEVRTFAGVEDEQAPARAGSTAHHRMSATYEDFEIGKVQPPPAQKSKKPDYQTPPAHHERTEYSTPPNRSVASKGRSKSIANPADRSVASKGRSKSIANPKTSHSTQPTSHALQIKQTKLRWWRPDMTRKQAEHHLRGRKPGSFIVRESKKETDHLVVSVLKAGGPGPGQGPDKALFNGLIKNKRNEFTMQGGKRAYRSIEEVIQALIADKALAKGFGLPIALALPPAGRQVDLNASSSSVTMDGDGGGESDDDLAC